MGSSVGQRTKDAASSALADNCSHGPVGTSAHRPMTASKPASQPAQLTKHTTRPSTLAAFLVWGEEKRRDEKRRVGDGIEEEKRRDETGREEKVTYDLRQVRYSSRATYTNDLRQGKYLPIIYSLSTHYLLIFYSLSTHYLFITYPLPTGLMGGCFCIFMFGPK